MNDELRGAGEDGHGRIRRAPEYGRREMLSDEARQDLMEQHILRWVRKGYRVWSRTPTTCQLVKPRQWTAGWTLAFLAGLFMAGIGSLLVLLVYFLQKDQLIYLQIGYDGAVQEEAKR